MDALVAKLRYHVVFANLEKYQVVFANLEKLIVVLVSPLPFPCETVTSISLNYEIDPTTQLSLFGTARL